MSKKLSSDAVKLYADIKHYEERQKIETMIYLLEDLGGNYNNKFQSTIDYLYGYVQGSKRLESAKELASWERDQNEN